MSEISCRTPAVLLEALRRNGHDEAEVIRAANLEGEVLGDPARKLPWDDFLVLLHAIEARHGPQIWGPIGATAAGLSWNRPMRGLARFLWTEAQFWRIVVRKVAPRHYPHLGFGFETLDDARFRLRVAIPPGHQGSESFLRMLGGILRAGPRFMGASGETETEAEISPHLGIFTVRPTRSLGFVRRLLRGLGGQLLGAPAVAELERRQSAAERTAETLEVRNRSLATLQAVADAVNQSLDFAGTAQRIVDAVAEHTHFPAVLLYTSSEDGAELELAAGLGPDGPATRLPRVLPPDRRVVGRALRGQRVQVVAGEEGLAQLHPLVRERVLERRMQSVAVVPLLFHDRTVGILGFGFFDRRRFDSDEEQWLLALGKTAAAALMSARHVRRIECEMEQRARVERELRESEERLRQVAENVHGVFYLLDAATDRVLYLSPNFEELTGYPAERILENPRAYFELIHPDDRERVAQVAGGTGDLREYTVEYRVVRSDGSCLSVLDRVSLVRDAAGRAVRIAGFAQDITEMRELELQLRHSQKMEAVGRLAGGIAHDFNNLLTVITGYGEVLRNRLASDDPDRETVAEILRAAERAAELTRQLLALGRKQPPTVGSSDLNQVVRELGTMLRSLVGEEAGLRIELAPEALGVAVDRSQLEQVLVNLVVNARDAMPTGGTVFVATDLAGAGGEALRARLTVRDTGVGMDAETRARVFEPFFSTKAPGRGTGLGLAMVYGIVEQAGGRIEIDSAPGQGTRVVVELPLVPVRARREARPAPAAKRRGSETLLLVEDQGAVRDVAGRILRECGYRVIEAADAAEALERLRSSPVDLLVTDVVMPDMRGTELAARAAESNPRLPVLFVSGYTGVDEEEPSWGRPGDGFLAKPFSPNELARAVREILDAPAPG